MRHFLASTAASTLRLSLLCLPLTTVPTVARAQDHVWQGQNGWEIVYAKIPGGSSAKECALNWDPDNADHRLFWTWDAVRLAVGFMGAAPPGSPHGQLPDRSSLYISVDGRTLEEASAHGIVSKPNPAYGQMLFIEARTVAWDINNPGHDAGLETDAVFDILRHGHKLTVRIYGKTYVEDLTGVSSALDLFPSCIQYMEERL